MTAISADMTLDYGTTWLSISANDQSPPHGFLNRVQLQEARGPGGASVLTRANPPYAPSTTVSLRLVWNLRTT
jgi:hypothetical protein